METSAGRCRFHQEALGGRWQWRGVGWGVVWAVVAGMLIRGTVTLAGPPPRGGAGWAATLDPDTEREIENDARAFERLLVQRLLGVVPVPESEPNDTPATADVISGGGVATGTISPPGDVDVWRSSGHQAGELVFVAGPGFVGLDPGFTVLGHDQVTVIGSDPPGDGTACLLGAEVSQSGDLYIELEDRFGLGSFVYQLNHAVVPPGETTAEIEPNDTPSTATPLRVAITEGSIVQTLDPATRDHDHFSFFAPQGSTVRVLLDTDLPGNEPLMLELFHTSPNGTSLGGTSSTPGGPGCGNPATVPVSGIHTLEIRTGAATAANQRYRLLVLIDGAPAPLPFDPELEPNGTAATATPIGDGRMGVGSIDTVADLDLWVARGKRPGDLAFAFVDTSGSSGNTDSLLDLFAQDQTTLIESDDDDGPGLSSCVAGAVVPQIGNVYLRVREDTAGTIAPYRLHQGIFRPSQVRSETEGNDELGQAEILSAPVTAGSLELGDPADHFAFFAAAGDPLVVILDENPDDDASLLDAELRILDPNGVVIAQGDDQASGDANCAAVASAPFTGTYFVRLRPDGVPLGDRDYRFTVLAGGTPRRCVFGLKLRERLFSGAQVARGCDRIEVGPDIVVGATGRLRLEAGERVSFRPGFSVHSGGRLSVAIGL